MSYSATWLLLLATTSVLADSVTGPYCSAFIPSDSLQLQSSTTTLRVSEIVNCTGSSLGTNPALPQKQCNNSTLCSLAMPLNYYVRVNSTFSTPLPRNDSRYDFAQFEQELLQTVQFLSPNNTGANGTPPQYANSDFNQSSVRQVDSASACISNGTAAYWAFTPFMNCIKGSFRGCYGDAASLESVPVTVCGAKLLPGGGYDGELHIVITDGIPAGGVAAPANATAVTRTGNSSPALSSAKRRTTNELMTMAALAMVVMITLFSCS